MLSQSSEERPLCQARFDVRALPTSSQYRLGSIMDTSLYSFQHFHPYIEIDAFSYTTLGNATTQAHDGISLESAGFLSIFTTVSMHRQSTEISSSFQHRLLVYLVVSTRSHGQPDGRSQIKTYRGHYVDCCHVDMSQGGYIMDRSIGSIGRNDVQTLLKPIKISLWVIDSTVILAVFLCQSRP